MSHVCLQEELDQLATEITQGLHYHKTNNIVQQQQIPQHDHHLTVVASGVYGSGSLYDTAETDSAFSDNASLPSSESFTSMGTFSSSADTTSSSSGETCSMNSAVCGVNHGEVSTWQHYVDDYYCFVCSLLAGWSPENGMCCVMVLHFIFLCSHLDYSANFVAMMNSIVSFYINIFISVPFHLTPSKCECCNKHYCLGQSKSYKFFQIWPHCKSNPGPY